MTGERAANDRSAGQDRLASDLRSLGVRSGQDLLVHSSMRQIGRVAGGAATLLAAIRNVAGPTATIVVPAETTWNSLSSRAFLDHTVGLGPADLARHIAAMQGFDPQATPSTGMGAFAEHVRTRRGAKRSAHPQSSFAAVGPRAESAMSVHDLDCHLGERSPLGWLYKAGAAVVLLGVGYRVCTAFHLAEYRVRGWLPRRDYHCFTTSGGVRTARTFTDIDLKMATSSCSGRRWRRPTGPTPRPRLAMGGSGWPSPRGCRCAPQWISRALGWRSTGGISMTASGPSLMLRLADRYDGTTRRWEGCLVPLNEETPFFLSYPRIDGKLANRGGARSSDRLVQQFFDDLCEDVATLVHLPYGCDMGFMDIEALPGGMNWPPALIHALGNCQVLVGLLSMPYLMSEWCGKEWHAFALRERTSKASANPYQGCIIPVLWAPIVGKLPAAVGDHVNVFQPKPTRRDPDLPQRYLREGIFGLVREHEEDSVKEIVWQLAKLIQRIYYGQRLEPRQFETHELTNIFEEGES